MTWEILDCTFRDGGYYTDWDFDENLVKQYINTVCDLPVRYIEIGYRNPPQRGYAGKHYYISSDYLDNLIEAGIDSDRLCIMLDAKHVEPSGIKGLLDSCRGKLGRIRLAIKPEEIRNGLILASEVKNLGFEVGVNIMYMHDHDSLITAVKEISKSSEVVDLVTLVDSYGSCFPNQIRDEIEYVKSILPHKIGFHGHDNMHLAFANAISAITAGVDIIDSTILGMGRGAGNLKTELLLIYWASVNKENIDFSELGIFLEYFQKQLGNYEWGTSLPYIISGIEQLPQKEVMKWIGMKRYSTPTIIRKLRYNHNYTMNSLVTDDSQVFQANVNVKAPCLILGGGETVKHHAPAIKEFADKNGCIIIHSSLKSVPIFADYKADQYACLPGEEYRRLKNLDKTILEGIDAFVVNQELINSPHWEKILNKRLFLADSDLKFTKKYMDNPLSLSLGTAPNITNSKYYYLAGFDGYSHKGSAEHEIELETQQVMDEFTGYYSNISLSSITKTTYKIKKLSVYALLESK